MTLICVDAKDKTLDQVGRDFEAAVKKQGFGILTVHNIKETLTKKGVAFEPECKIYEICNAQQAKQVLEQNLALSVMLPCRVSIFKEGPLVKLVTISPVSMVEAFGNQKLNAVAAEVGKSIESMMHEAVRS